MLKTENCLLHSVHATARGEEEASAQVFVLNGRGRFVQLVRGRLAHGVTICLIEHNLDIVHGISDRIAFLDQGTVLAAGEPRAILNDSKLAAIYFGERR